VSAYVYECTGVYKAVCARSYQNSESVREKWLANSSDMKYNNLKLNTVLQMYAIFGAG
jgi:hypothetical protein